MKIFKYIIVMFFVMSFLACSNDQKKGTSDRIKPTEIAESYTCPMHPQIIKSEPGACPICGMDLVKINTQNKKMGLELSESQINLANIRTMKVGNQNFEDAKLINAKLVVNPINTAIVASKFAGRVDQLFYQETGVRINKGQPVYKIYSEELLTLQKDFILNYKQQKAFPNEDIYKTLLNASKSKLKLYGYSENQINQLLNGNKTNPYIIVYAPIGGIISEINISEGQYVGLGSPVFKIENLDNVWVEADIYPSELAEVKIGKEVNIIVSGFENENIKAKIEFISPQLNPQSQIITIRSSIKNVSNKYQPGMQANLSFAYINKNDVISIPIDAIIRDESGSYVWVETSKNNFKYKMVQIDSENEKLAIIKNGLKNGDEVVISGAYLLTSEYTLKKGGDFMAGMNM